MITTNFSQNAIVIIKFNVLDLTREDDVIYELKIILNITIIIQKR